MQQRPGEGALGLQLGWTLIEVRRYGDALQTLGSATYATGVESQDAMARAVARWQAQEPDQAMVDFNAALSAEPVWSNSKWISALYSPLVARSIQEMQVERERRKQKTR